MPFHVEIGPNWEVLEDYLNGDAGRLTDLLANLRAGADLMDLGLFDSTSLLGGPRPPAQVKDHGRADWFGMRPRPGGGWEPQAPFDPVTNPSTGYWQQWYGDAEGIVRTTLQRAVEVALGVDPDAPVDASVPPARHWPIDILIKCTQAWMEGWVSWRAHGGTGHVTVIFAVPGNGHPLLTSPLAPPARSLPEYGCPPAACSGARGLWLIGHSREVAHHVRSHGPSLVGDWVLPHFGQVFEGEGPIVTVAPSEADGGVLAAGRPYQI